MLQRELTAVASSASCARRIVTHRGTAWQGHFTQGVAHSCITFQFAPRFQGYFARTITTNAAAPPTNFKVLWMYNSAENIRIDSLLRSRLQLKTENHPVSLGLLHKWARSGLLRIQTTHSATAIRGEAILRYRMQQGDVLLCHTSVLNDVTFSEGMSSSSSISTRAAADQIAPKWVQSCVKFVTEDFVVISKPAGIATQGGTGLKPQSTVDHWLPHIALLPTSADTSIASLSPAQHPQQPLKLVHRLDKEVSGLLLLARGAGAAEQARAALATRQGIKKVYVAVVRALPARSVSRSGVLRSPLSTDDDRAVVTRYQFIDHPLLQQRSTSVVMLEPLTGRKHQLRIHATHLFNHKAGIMYDTKYAPASETNSVPKGVQHIFLHAIYLGIHMGGHRTDVWDSLPPHFVDLLNQLRVPEHVVTTQLRAFIGGLVPPRPKT